VPQHARRGRVGRPKARHGLRVRQRLWSIDAWSVFKLSALFYLCVCLIIMVAATLLWNVGRSVGTIDQFESFISRMGAYGTCTTRAEVPSGAEFATSDDCGPGEVLVGGFTFDDGTLFKAAVIGSGILVVAGSIGSVLLVVLLNLLNELTGGLRHTVVKEPVARPAPGARARVARPVATRPGDGRSRTPWPGGRERPPSEAAENAPVATTLTAPTAQHSVVRTPLSGGSTEPHPHG
jgi:hypothetical protein